MPPMTLRSGRRLDRVAACTIDFHLRSELGPLFEPMMANGKQARAVHAIGLEPVLKAVT